VPGGFSVDCWARPNLAGEHLFHDSIRGGGCNPGSPPGWNMPYLDWSELAPIPVGFFLLGRVQTGPPVGDRRLMRGSARLWRGSSTNDPFLFLFWQLLFVAAALRWPGAVPLRLRPSGFGKCWIGRRIFAAEMAAAGTCCRRLDGFILPGGFIVRCWMSNVAAQGGCRARPVSPLCKAWVGHWPGGPGSGNPSCLADSLQQFPDRPVATGLQPRHVAIPEMISARYGKTFCPTGLNGKPAARFGS